MDLGCCFDSDCVTVSDKLSGDTVLDSDFKESDANETVQAASKVGKKTLKEAGQSPLNALKKFTSQLKKPPHRRGSPINWFPRKKVDSYLKRKIELIQEVGGMNSTLDETLGDSNPHYCRVLREKIASREAAIRAMEARKAALVEASWCRILRAARIGTKEAEVQLLNAEKIATEAFEEAAANGVIMYDKEVGAPFEAVHTVAASFETAFEVDKEVAAAVKTAFTRLANCTSFSKDEFKELLQKISQNPDTGHNNQELVEFSSECVSESGSELEIVTHINHSSTQGLDKITVDETRPWKDKQKQSPEKFKMVNLVDLMLERLKCLREDELSSLATIVATCGLNAALAEVENSKQHGPGSTSALDCSQRSSSLGVRKKRMEPEVQGLDKFLVKHLTKLEKEIQQAKKLRRNELEGPGDGNAYKLENRKVGNIISSDTVTSQLPSLDKFLVKHMSKLEKEVQQAKNKRRNDLEGTGDNNLGKTGDREVIIDNSMISSETDSIEFEKEFKGTNKMRKQIEPDPELPSLDKFLVKHVSKHEKEVEEAKNAQKNAVEGTGDTLSKIGVISSDAIISSKPAPSTYADGESTGKENINLNKEVNADLKMGKIKVNAQETEDCLEKILVKPMHRLERERKEALSFQSSYGNHKLINKQEGGESLTNCESLDKVLVKHLSRLEKEKMTAPLQSGEQTRSSVTRRAVREKELQETWGGLSLGDAIHRQPQPNQIAGGLDQNSVKHKSRLEREKMAAAQQPVVEIRPFVSRKHLRDKELQDTWGGLSLGNSMKPHVSKLEREKADWIRAEEEEKTQAKQSKKL